MCIGVPHQLASVDGFVARSIEGQVLDVSLFAGELRPGDWVLIHVGTAVRFLDAEEALAIRNALAAADAAASGLPFDHLLADLVDREPTLPTHLTAQGDER